MSNERAKLLTPEAKEMYSALYCLNLEVVPSIAEDVKAKVLAAVYAERQASRVAALAEAEKIAEDYNGDPQTAYGQGVLDTAKGIAAAIRSRAEAPTKEK